MRKHYIILSILIITAFISLSFNDTTPYAAYISYYNQSLNRFTQQQNNLIVAIQKADLTNSNDVQKIREEIRTVRYCLKSLDFWLRYLEPTAYKKINGPLPVEWETEVFEKYEKPYKREGAGLALATLYLDEPVILKDSLLSLIKASINATNTYKADSITKELQSYHHFFLCNRLYLLNLAAIYTTGFECPDTTQIIIELRTMMKDVEPIYTAFNKSFPNTPLSSEYQNLYNKAIRYSESQPADYSRFDHFTFIKDYVNPLFILNQKMIAQYHVISHSLVDYSLNKTAPSIFDKSLYRGQNTKGIFLRVDDTAVLAKIEALGKQLFYDPILSGNNMRSCASCHKPTEYFTDTLTATSIQFNHTDYLPRNSPSLINAQYNHLLMLDGKHISLQNQAKDVITNPLELGCAEKDMLEKILSCKEYYKGFKELLQYTPQEPDVTMEHIASALTVYYCKFSNYYSPFDDAINNYKPINAEAKAGFNLFMGKAQCATCHFVPQFNGVKPPYISSEFEVLGVPKDKNYLKLNDDKGRYGINPANETMMAFRTGSIRNTEHTAPYMHNGVFRTMEEVIDFYDAGGGIGHGLKIDNQTLSSDSLKLNKTEKKNLLAFIRSLNENIPFEAPPATLPQSKNKALNNRKIGGEY
ncbi:MAG: cytochrome C peroxidase [Bacteroidetes bacterium]|nr:cytochrome C peroxidase [Bacteroidota bacterium]